MGIAPVESHHYPGDLGGGSRDDSAGTRTMSASTAATWDSRGGEKRSSLSRWHRLFHLLVACAVFTVALSVYLSHQFMRIYAHSVVVNQAWVERLHACSEVGQLAAGVNAPGNDVFQSHQVEVETHKMHAALRRFDERLDAFQEELRSNV